jgi:hypothetical protein
VSTTVTVRPAGAPTLEILPVISTPGGARPFTQPTAPPAGQGARSLLVAAVGVGVVVVVAAVLIRTFAHAERTPEAVDAAPPVVQLGHAPSASVDLVPAELPPPSAADAAGVTPLEPVPSASPRHSRGKPTK